MWGSNVFLCMCVYSFVCICVYIYLCVVCLCYMMCVCVIWKYCWKKSANYHSWPWMADSQRTGYTSCLHHIFFPLAQIPILPEMIWVLKLHQMNQYRPLNWNTCIENYWGNQTAHYPFFLPNSSIFPVTLNMVLLLQLLLSSYIIYYLL